MSATSGWLEEWMSDDNLGETTHRHLSPLIGLFPGDRIAIEDSPAELVTGATKLLEARGMASFGWASAWRAIWSIAGRARRSTFPAPPPTWAPD